MVESDSRARGGGFNTYLRPIVSLSKDTFTPRNVLVTPRKRWLCPDMTEKLLTGTLSININKQKFYLLSSVTIMVLRFWTLKFWPTGLYK